MRYLKIEYQDIHIQERIIVSVAETKPAVKLREFIFTKRP